MLDLFICLLKELYDVNYGTVTEANMYSGGGFSTITLKTDNGIYKVSISKETEQETDGNS